VDGGREGEGVYFFILHLVGRRWGSDRHRRIGSIIATLCTHKKARKYTSIRSRRNWDLLNFFHYHCRDTECATTGMLRIEMIVDARSASRADKLAKDWHSKLVRTWPGIDETGVSQGGFAWTRFLLRTLHKVGPTCSY
jgi:hypothetical protein